MYRLITTILLGVAFAATITAAPASPRHWRPTLADLDRVIDSSNVYDRQYEQRIAKAKQKLSRATNDADRLDLTRQLFFMYKQFVLDSAYVYADRKLQVAQRIGNKEEVQFTQLDIAAILIKNGDYIAAIRQLQSLDRPSMSTSVQTYYYSLYGELYESKRLTALTKAQKDYYEHLRVSYRDSLRNLQTTKSIWDTAEFLRTRHKYTDALHLLVKAYDNLDVSNRDMGYIAYAIADIYDKVDDTERVKQYLIISAISDIKNSVREYISLRRLAIILYEEGDVDRAYRYMRKSLEDATECNAKLRIFEVSDVLPIIDKAYDSMKAAERRHLTVGLAVVVVLLVLLVCMVFYTGKQLRHIAQARRQLLKSNESLAEMNSKLNSLNTQITSTNEQLNDANSRLRESNASLGEANKIKNIYIMEFMSKCSSYIDKLEAYRRSLNKLAAAGMVSELYRKLKSKTIIDDEVEEFFEDFDRIFLKIFPSFVSTFNALLRPEESIKPKHEGRLSTELRIYALMRLGIVENENIASFLRCSKQTVYSYRSRIRLRSLCPDDFENQVLRIDRCLTIVKHLSVQHLYFRTPLKNATH